MTQQIPSLVAAKEVLFIWKHHETGAQSFIIATLEDKMMKGTDGFHCIPATAFVKEMGIEHPRSLLRSSEIFYLRSSEIF